MIKAMYDWMQGKPKFPRHKHWPKVRAAHLEVQGYCQLCLGTTLLEVHHKKPCHLFPQLELDLFNLITLCERNGCHFLIGHLRDWRAFNPAVVEDIAWLRTRIQCREYGSQ